MVNQPCQVLLVDDDRQMTALLQDYLKTHGFEVEIANDGESGLATLATKTPAVVVLDIMMPGMDGLECLRNIRRTSQVPIIMLTARGDDTDRIVGLELGADDYLGKPFNPRELVARIKGILRRTQRSAESATLETESYQFPTFCLNVVQRQLIVDGKEVALTTVEFELLACLIRNAGKVMSRDRLFDEVWGQDYAAVDRTIDVHISHLRQKIKDDVKSPRYIKTIWGMGYVMVPEQK